MSFAMSSLWDALGRPLPSRVPLSITTFISYVIPPVVCYFIFAVLAVTPYWRQETRAIRVALWPILALLALRAAVSVDMSLGKPEAAFHNVGLMNPMLYITLYSLSWASAKHPFVRRLRPANGSSSVTTDALDFALNPRGIGWDWSRGLHVPQETRPTNRMAFALYALASGIAHTFLCGTLYVAICTFAAGVRPSPNREAHTIYDETLPFVARHLRTGVISTMAAFGAYAAIQMSYDISTVFGVLVLGQDPAQWPPAFDQPWRATSLGDFWARRWHQSSRHMLLVCAHPCYVVFGRAGRVIGAFLASGVFHYLSLLSFGHSEFWRMLVGFGMMGPGVLAERAFYKLTGRKVNGVAGWLWTMAWLVVWGSPLVEGLARTGIFVPVDGSWPGRALVETLVARFDAWLYAI